MTQQQNPFPPPRPPSVLSYQTPGVSDTGVVCPKCSSPQSQKVGFTWWGGLVGPRILSHVKCLQCGTGYNGKTGKSNDTAIAIYLVAGVLLGVAIVVLFAMAK